MVRVAPIRLYYNPKTLWFDPGELEVHTDDAVVVSTARGTEFGYATGEAFEVDDAQVKRLKCALKPVKRLATEEDIRNAAEMERRAVEALPVFKEMAAELNEDMRPVSVEYLLEGDKAVFYFEAEERVDFRELVRRLAAHFHIRVDMRQIGVRDEARMVGGFGHCGQELCCKRLGGEFCPVSIRMAKEQDLSLNPQKISGVCGRLMCCLRYEFEAYKDFKTRAPKKNAQVETPDGAAKVISLDVPREIVLMKTADGQTVKVPLADFDPAEEGVRPSCVGKEAWERATTQGPLAIEGSATYATSQLTGEDKLADPTSVRHTGSKASTRRGTKGQAKAGGTGAGGKGAKGASDEGRKPRRRRSTKVGADGTAAKVEDGKAAKEKQSQGRQASGAGGGAAKKRQQAAGTGKRQRQGGGKPAQAKGGPRPGQKSSALRQKPAGQGGEARRDGEAAAGGAGGRRPRRRTHRANGAGGGAGRGAGSQGGSAASGGAAPSAGA